MTSQTTDSSVAVLKETNDQIDLLPKRDLGNESIIVGDSEQRALNASSTIRKGDAIGSSNQSNLTDSTVTQPVDDVVEGEVTPPLPNGEKRLHPLFDEDKIASEAAAVAAVSGTGNDSKVETYSDSEEGTRPNALRLMESLGNDAGYPSPSGGFVPPITDDNWALQQPPEPRSAHPLSSSTNETQSVKAPQPQRPSSLSSSKGLSDRRIQGSSSKEDLMTVLEMGVSKNAENQSESILASDSKMSSSYSSASGSFENGVNAAHSQAISARSSPSTLAPVRRRSSSSADLLNMSTITPNQDNDAHLPSLKVRDFAYEEIDPRHIGARDVGLSSPDRKRGSGFGMSQFGGHSLGGQEWGTGVDEYEDDDEDEEDEEGDGNGSLGYGDESAGNLSTSSTGLPPGLYHAAYDFSAESDHELDVKVGQKVRLIGHVDGGWAIVVRVREGQEDVAADEEETEKGLVPEAYLEWLGQ